jgi:AraC-like DNA-binding protein
LTRIQSSKNALFQKLPLTPGNSFVVDRYESPLFETPWHFHEEYELVLCEKGYGMKLIGNGLSPYQEGEMAFIGKNVPHLFKADDTLYQPQSQIRPSSVVIQFQEDFLGRDFFQTAEMSAMKKLLAASMNGLMIMGETRTRVRNLMLSMLECGPAEKLVRLISIFGILSASHELENISPDEVSGINVYDSLKMNKVIEYALTHFRGDISIKQAAQLANLSESAFCRYFKSRTQKTFLSFVIEMRLQEASRLLMESELSILGICYETGFKNLSNFNRQFRRKFNENPGKHRQAKK